MTPRVHFACLMFAGVLNGSDLQASEKVQVILRAWGFLPISWHVRDPKGHGPSRYNSNECSKPSTRFLMTILVPVKRVVDPYAKVRPLADGSGIDTGGVKFEINPFDEIAVEEAVRIKEKHPDTQIVVVSIGTGDCEEQLRKALAMGADQAILVETDHQYDSLGIAKELAAIVAKVQPQIVLMGKQATDDDCNQAGQMLAAILDWPQACFASAIEVQSDKLRVHRETDLGVEVLELGLPALVTTDLRLNEPRYIALPGIIKARSKPLERIAPTVLSQPKTRTVRFETPPARPAGRKVASVDELVQELKNRGALPA